jgi:hypothetical protein
MIGRAGAVKNTFEKAQVTDLPSSMSCRRLFQTCTNKEEKLRKVFLMCMWFSGRIWAEPCHTATNISELTWGWAFSTSSQRMTLYGLLQTTRNLSHPNTTRLPKKSLHRFEKEHHDGTSVQNILMRKPGLHDRTKSWRSKHTLHEQQQQQTWPSCAKRTSS